MIIPLILYYEINFQVVKKSLVTFVNKHLNKINLDVNDLDTQFADGVYLCLLSGLLEGYFVPLHDFHLTPQVLYLSILQIAHYFYLMHYLQDCMCNSILFYTYFSHLTKRSLMYP